MKDHETHGEAVRDALARGDLEQAKREAAVLARLRLQGHLDEEWKEKLDAMNVAAAGCAGSQDLKAASRALALLAKTCGDCHTMLGWRGPVVGVAAWQALGPRSYMMRHQWAATRLWDGLVVPSDEAWKAGASGLSESQLGPQVLTPGKTPGPEIGVLVQSVHDLGRRAEGATQVESRVELYGETMATCAVCHQWLGGGPSEAR